jgi:hypothetical protein
MIFRLGYFFKTIGLIGLLSNSSVFADNDLDQGFVENIKSGKLDAISTEIGKAWFSIKGDKAEHFKKLHTWAKEDKNAKLEKLSGILISSEPEYCFGVRQSHLFIQHHSFLRKSENLQAYEQDMALLHAALNSLRNIIRQRAEAEAASYAGPDLAKEFIKHAALSKTVEERNAILFEQGYDEKMSDAAWYFLQEVIILNLCEFDYENTEWIKATIPLIGWPSLTGLDQGLDKVAAFLIRRAYDLPFKKRIVRQLEPFYEAGEIDKASFEYLQAVVTSHEITNDHFVEANMVARTCHAP